jgi:hypothetical protein
MKQRRFDQNDAIFTSRKKRRRKKPDDLSYGCCSSFSIFVPEKAARMTTFSEHLMLHLSTKSDKPYSIYDNLTLYYTPV